MNATERDAWNSRTATVTVKERCDHRETLQPDVKERSNAWVKATTCSGCFSKLVADAQSLIYC